MKEDWSSDAQRSTYSAVYFILTRCSATAFKLLAPFLHKQHRCQILISASYVLYTTSIRNSIGSSGDLISSPTSAKSLRFSPADGDGYDLITLIVVSRKWTEFEPAFIIGPREKLESRARPDNIHSHLLVNVSHFPPSTVLECVHGSTVFCGNCPDSASIIKLDRQ
eukprot:IDg1163t1